MTSRFLPMSAPPGVTSTEAANRLWDSRIPVFVEGIHLACRASLLPGEHSVEPVVQRLL
jgi:hypothetical protein